MGPLAGFGAVQAGARIAAFETWSAAAVLAVSSGSAGGCRSHPGMVQISAVQKKTLGPGALDRGFLLAFVTLDRAAR